MSKAAAGGETAEETVRAKGHRVQCPEARAKPQNGKTREKSA
jgi:hypothetical protein